MTTWKPALSILAAFTLGAFAVYAIMSPRHPEEWGVVAVQFGFGPNLWGLFESKAECLDAKPDYMKLWAQMVDGTRTGRRSMTINTGGEKVPVTFSCLPRSEIRGLHLDVGLGRPSK